MSVACGRAVTPNPLSPCLPGSSQSVASMGSTTRSCSSSMTRPPTTSCSWSKALLTSRRATSSRWFCQVGSSSSSSSYAPSFIDRVEVLSPHWWLPISSSLPPLALDLPVLKFLSLKLLCRCGQGSLISTNFSVWLLLMVRKTNNII